MELTRQILGEICHEAGYQAKMETEEDTYSSRGRVYLRLADAADALETLKALDETMSPDAEAPVRPG